MIKDKKLAGSITLFSAMIFLVVFSLFITLIQSAYHSATRARIDSALALAAESAFAGYSNEVFNRYGIFVLENSAQALARTREVLSANMAGSKAGIQSVYFANETRMTDNGGEPFYRQVVDYMQSDGIGNYVKEALSGEADRAKNSEKIGNLAEKISAGTKTGASEDDILKDINEILNDAGINESTGVSDAVKNGLKDAAGKEKGTGEIPRDHGREKSFNDTKKLLGGDIVTLVLGKNARISDKKLDAPGWEQNEKTVLKDSLSGKNVNAANDVLFREYILMTFDTYTDTEAGASNENPAYGVEYIIGGKLSDRQNLETVMRKIFLIREGLNFTYILTHGNLKTQATAFAAALFGWTLNPLIIKAAEYAVMALWAGAESVVDLKNLYGGKKVAFIKGADSWNLSLEGVLKGNLNGTADNKKGFDYKDYLRLILIGNTSVQCARSMDLIEMRMIRKGNRDFRMRNCIFSMGITGDFVLPFGRQEYLREYEYAYSKQKG